MRAAAIACVALTGLVGLWAASEAMGLSRLSELEEIQPPADSLLGAPDVLRAQMQALEGMREARSLTLTGLAVACAVAFVAAMRLLRPVAIPRERMRQVLGGAALVAAVFRTLDGAQLAVVAKRMAGPLAKAVASLPELSDPADAAELTRLMPSLFVAGVALQTALVSGALALFALYFRSERVRQSLEGLDHNRT